jgi:rubredoxin
MGVLCARPSGHLGAHQGPEAKDATGIPMRLNCPSCGELHIDEGEFSLKPHHTHACQKCGMVWRPAVVNTTGVRFLPGYRNP